MATHSGASSACHASDVPVWAGCLPGGAHLVVTTDSQAHSFSVAVWDGERSLHGNLRPHNDAEDDDNGDKHENTLVVAPTPPATWSSLVRAGLSRAQLRKGARGDGANITEELAVSTTWGREHGALAIRLDVAATRLRVAKSHTAFLNVAMQALMSTRRARDDTRAQRQALTAMTSELRTAQDVLTRARDMRSKRVTICVAAVNARKGLSQGTQSRPEENES